ncbi:MAG: sugar ABC transporter substrate-binding protein, partial [Geminicoccales bacterium]
MLLVACGDQPDQGVTIDFWAMGREGEVVQKLTEDFERQHPGIRVRVQQIPWSAAHEKLLTAYAGDAMPDLFQLGNTWIPEFVALEAVADLDDRLGASAGLDGEDFFEGSIEANRIDGRLYGIPWYVDTRLLFYRKDLLEQAGHARPPRSWDEWMAAMESVVRRAGPDHYAILLPIDEWDPVVILALQLDAQLLKGDAQCGNFESPRFREALGFYLSMFENGVASAMGTAQMANLYQEFAKGRFALYISGPWNLEEFARRLPEGLQDAWATAPMPAPDGRYPGISLAGGASLAIYRGSKHKDEAWQLIEYLADVPQQVRFYRLNGNLPARRSAWRAADLADEPHTRAFWDQLQRLRSTPKIPEWERIAASLERQVERLVRKETTVDRALAALDGEVDQILEKRRWLLARAQG